MFILKWQNIHVISNCNTLQNLAKQFAFYSAESYLERCQMSKMNFLRKGVQLITSFAKSSILDVWISIWLHPVNYKDKLNIYGKDKPKKNFKAS